LLSPQHYPDTKNMSKAAVKEQYMAFATELKQLLRDWLGQFSGKTVSLRLTGAQQALLASYLATQGRTVFGVISGSNTNTRQHWRQLQAWQEIMGREEAWHIIEGPLSEQERQGLISTDTSVALHHLLFFSHTSPSTPHHYILGEEAAQAHYPDPAAYLETIVRIVRGETASRTGIIESLIAAGYARHRTSLEPGSLRVRGEHVDIASPILAGYFSLNFFGNRIEHIIHYIGERSTSISSIALPPVLFPPASVPFTKLVAAAIVISPEQANIAGEKTFLTDALHPADAFPLTDVKKQLPANKRTYILYRHLDRVQAFVRDHTAAVNLLPSALSRFPFHLSAPEWEVATEESLLPSPPSTSPVSRQRAFELISSLTAGKPAVHSHHGIGLYEGLQVRSIGGQEHEYLVLRYAGGDAISVPVEYAHKVTPYIGEGSPTIHRLGGAAWKAARKQAQEDAAAFAQELLAIARARKNHERAPYAITPSFEDKLAQGVDYELTPDQERTWEEVRADLELTVPMDRLVVGDVGFGKTEIALRAALHVVGSGKQVALLAPTTILAQQHADTFRRRLAPYHMDIALLSRATLPADEKKYLAGIALGAIPIAVGTHALLSAKVSWKHLGLVIIDEEQRFGVKQKEQLKKIRATVDLLSLSATPIPRSLSMALSGLRQLSIISTPPAGRQDVDTIVAADSDAILQEAISKELARGGQAYVVAPKISQLQPLYERIQALVPQARAIIAHGRLPVEKLAAIMHRFDEGDINVLVSSSIVEHGLDLPNANTMIVVPATHFGLADLYQLRGRIGRRTAKGRAYFLYQQQTLSPIQRQRLTALTQASRVGSGWAIAQHDLEIRGAGNLLGKEQSGTASAVGVQLYVDMIEDAIEESSQPGKPRGAAAEITLPLPALLPTHYIPDADERTKWYQRLSRARNLEALHALQEELTGLFGPLPAESANMILLLELQLAATSAGIAAISYRTISPADEDPYMRLEITSQRLPAVLAKLQTLGNWVVKNNQATWDVDAITPELLKKIMHVLL
jgi:transcription-repair coupling factor (superfamily II helicase)